MAVLAEAISVILQIESIESGPGWDEFNEIVTNDTGCADGFLVRVGFMTPVDVESFINEAERIGLNHQIDGTAKDLVVVDQKGGCTTPCDWVEVGKINLGPGSVVACRHVDDESKQVFTPDGWEYSGSLSETYGFAPNESVEKGLKFLRHEDGLDVYLSELTGKEVYVGRS